MSPVTIVGSYLSPYVRKVLVCLLRKGLAYEIDPIVPYLGDDAFSALSPLRRVPVYRDDLVTLCDSSVICQYLEDRFPDPSLYPADIALRARARWLEEYADSRMGDVFIWRLFNQAAILPYVWGRPRDKALIAETIANDVPQVLDYLEGELPVEGFACGALSIADISIASFFRNAALARFTPDPERHPKTAAYVARVLAEPEFVALEAFEQVQMRTPIAEHRAALAAAGAPVTATTHGTAAPGADADRLSYTAGQPQPPA